MALGAGVNQGIGFGMTFYLQDEFTQVASRITASMTNLDQLSNQYANSIQGSFQRGVNSIQSGAANIASGFAMMIPIGYGLKMAGEFESVQIQLETLLKSKDAAKSFFEDLKKDALTLPLLGFKDLAQGSGYLIGVGISAQKAREDLNNLAKSIMAVGGTKDGFNRMSYNMSQIKAMGKAEALDIKQFAKVNIPIAQYLKKATGKNAYGGNITYDDVAKALAMFGKENDVTGAMMNSIVGQTAMLKENFEYLFAGIGEAIKPYFIKLAKGLNSVLTALTAFVQTPIGKAVARFVSLGVAFMSFGLIALGVMKILSGMKRIVATFVFDWKSVLSVVRPLVWQFAKLAVIFWAMTTLINSNSGALVTLGVVMSMFMGKMGIATAVFMLFARAYSAWNDFASGKNTNLTGLSGFFIKFGAILQGVLEIMNGLNEEGWMWSAEFDGKLRESGMYDTVVAIGTVIHGIYRAFAWVSSFFTTGLGQITAAVIAFIFIAVKLSVAISNISKGIGLLGKALVWLRGPSMAAILPWILWIGLFVTLIFLVYKIIDAFKNWHKMTGQERFVALVTIFTAIAGAITLAYYAVGTLTTAFSALALSEALALAPILAIVAAVTAAVWAINLLIENWDIVTSKFGKNEFGLLFTNPSLFFQTMQTGSDYRSGKSTEDTGFTPSQYMEQNGGDMRDLKSSMYNNPFNTSSSQSGDSGYQPLDQTIILQLDGYELHRQLISYGSFDNARSNVPS